MSHVFTGRRRWRCSALALVLGWLAATPAAARAGDQLPADVLKKVKQATVYLRVTLAGGRVVEGSGFLGGTNFLVTNAHVLGMLSPDGRRPQRIEVVVNSGEAGERKIAGQFQQMDPEADLAVVSVLPKDLPAPLTAGVAKGLVETQTLYVVGFPLGKRLGKNITVSKTSVSSLRKNPNGTLRQIQVSGGMHPGNSGGPVIDTKGQVVGVAAAGVRGTQLHFAIPGETVRNFLAGRLQTTVFLSPFKEGKTLKLPLLFRMVDPLLHIKKVQVATWTGKPGPPRKAVAKIGVDPLPEDSSHQHYELPYKDREAQVEVPLPPLSKDKVLWVQLSIQRTDGTRVWFAASTYDGQFAPVDRKPVKLAYQHLPDNPSQLDLTVTTTLKLRGLDGRDKHLVSDLKAQLVERVQGSADSSGAMKGTILFRKITVKTTLDRKALAPDKLLLNSLKSVQALRAETIVDKEGDLKTEKINVPVRDAVTRSDLFDLGGHLLLSLEAVTVPLPGEEVRHEGPWTSKRRLLFGSFRKGQEATAEVTFTYHGTRERRGRDEAVVFISGEVRGRSGAGLSANGNVHGQAVVDLKTKQVVYADTNMNLDFDLGSGKDSLQANGTLRIVLQRNALEGAERDRILKDKGAAVGPPVAKEAEPAAGAFATTFTGERFAFLQRHVKENRLAEVDVTGFRLSKNTYRDVRADGGILIGFQVGMGRQVIEAVRPIFLTKDGEKMGEWHGKATGEPITIKANPGYVVGSIGIRAGLRVDALSCKFIKLGEDRLRLDDHYTSGWVGGKGGNPGTVGHEGCLFVGICGHLDSQGTPCSLGLIAVLAKE